MEDSRLSGRVRLLVFLLQFFTIAGLLVGWQLLGSGQRSNLMIGSPMAVTDQLVRWATDPNRWVHIVATLQAAAAGFLLGTVVAIMAAILLGSSSAANRFASPLIAALNGIPKIALGPLFLLLFGIGMTSRIYFVATVVFFIPFYNLFMALRSIEPTYIHNVKMLGASPLWLLVDLYMPALFGVLISSFRLTASWAMIAAVIAEMLASARGIGHVINEGQLLLQSDVVLAGVIVISVIVLVLDRLFLLLERRLAPWSMT